MPITLLPDGSRDEQARMNTARILAEDIERVVIPRKASEGTIITALGLLFAGRAKTPEAAGKFATDITKAISICYSLKEQANAHPTRHG